MGSGKIWDETALKFLYSKLKNADQEAEIVGNRQLLKRYQEKCAIHPSNENIE